MERFPLVVISVNGHAIMTLEEICDSFRTVKTPPPLSSTKEVREELERERERASERVLEGERRRS